MSTSKRRRRHAVLTLIVLTLGFVSVAPSRIEPSGAGAPGTRWVLDDILTWPGEVALPTWADARASATDGAITYETYHPNLVQAGFDATWTPLPEHLEAGEPISITVSVAGRVIDPGDGGGAGGTAIQYDGSGTVPPGPDDLPPIGWRDSFTSVTCTGSGCSPSGTVEGTVSVAVPSTRGFDTDERFWVGVGMLNCGQACIVLYAYAAEGAPSGGAKCAGRAATPIQTGPAGELIGTAAADVIIGTNGPDRITGGGGDDIICGRGGADIIDAQGGSDRVLGGRGNDVIRGGPAGDTIDGGAGNDRVSGGGGTDRIDGGAGNDTMSGGPARDEVRGGGGADRIDGGAGSDTLSGSKGNDIIHGGDDLDDIDGGPGTDQCLAPDDNEPVRRCEIDGCDICGRDLIQDGGFESVEGGSRSDGEGAPPPRRPWVVVEGRPAVQMYDTGTFPEQLENLKGPNPDGGRNFLFGGLRRKAVLEQIVDVSSVEELVDQRLVTARLDGWLGGFGADPDKTTVSAEFLNDRGSVLGKISIGPVTADERDHETGFLRRSRRVWIPELTSQIRLVVTVRRTIGPVSDGYADNLRLILTDRPFKGT